MFQLQEFEDLDEIIARFIQPMAANARDFIQHKNYRDTGGKREAIEEELKKAKRGAPSRIPYFISASHALPGKEIVVCLYSKQCVRNFLNLVQFS